jgi:hypothetical protein
MALLNITKLAIEGIGPSDFDFKTSNMNIHVSTEQLRISQLQITEPEWLGNFN